MFVKLARLVARRPKTVIVVWAVAAAAMLLLALKGVGDGGVFQRAKTGLPTVHGADSTAVYDFQRAHADPHASTLLFVEVEGLSPTDPAAASAIEAEVEALAALDGVRSVTWPEGSVRGTAAPYAGDQPIAPQALRAADGSACLIAVAYDPDAFAKPAKEHERVAAGIHASLDPLVASPDAVRVYSDPLLYQDFTHQIERDLVTGEAVALPVALLVMVLVFGGFLAASIPLVGAFASIAGGLAVLFGFSYPISLDQSSINVVTVLAIGLSIDYGLLIVSRFREEIHKPDASAGTALAQTMVTAGRTVFFSAVTVAISVGGMLVFQAELIRGIGGAALGAVMMALATALTLIPALLVITADRLKRPSLVSRVPVLRSVVRRTADVSGEDGVFERLARTVQRAPWLVVGAVTAILLVLVSPLGDLAVRNSQHELLPSSNVRRQVLDTFDARYPALAVPQIRVLADATPPELDAWLAEASASVDGITRVTPAKEVDGKATAGIYTSYDDQASDEAVAIVRDLRAIDTPIDVKVGGQAAIQIDFVDSLGEGAPWAVGLVVLATFVLLFLMTGSLLVPIKTLLINGLSLSAAVGVVSWIFADGHLQGLLDFTTTGGIETYVLVMIIAFGFGLSMDYEVFLLARIKEHLDAGAGNDEAVRKGLQRSGRIITSAAAIIIIVFVGFATGKLLVIKEVGIGLAVAVFLDASLVRMLLVPATMTLLGRWNWWAPAALRRLYERGRIDH